MKFQNYLKTLKKSIFKLVLSLFTLVLLTNCSKDDDNGTSCLKGSWVQEVSSELEVWLAAASSYGENPTLENCTSYKSAINGYLNALDRIKKCVPTESLNEFNASIEEGKESLSKIDCSEN
ncbi:hypothetical protein [Maribacter sp. ACAM166]|uniref:hypothetical protein n=1 Tax=Maribacter sp. ACAM166 TaxID=2508996 RepID=UPI0010FD9834|nr:hypothetical protein [Maribacter sp. ACAM166]TLP74276.1 hypothetical protein ES765_16420 [Maribacter sp. ACAM166]